MSIVLNNNQALGWQFVVVSPDGGLLQTSKFEYPSAEIALSYARIWMATNL